MHITGLLILPCVSVLHVSHDQRFVTASDKAKKSINKQLTETDDCKDDKVLTILYNNNRQAIWYDMKGREDITHLKN